MMSSQVGLSPESTEGLKKANISPYKSLKERYISTPIIAVNVPFSVKSIKLAERYKFPLPAFST